MTTFFTVNTKFNDDARKAFFAELSTRLEMMSEGLDLETPEELKDIAASEALELLGALYEALKAKE